MVHENMYVVCQGCLTALTGAAFSIDDLLGAIDQIYPPGTRRLLLLCRVCEFVGVQDIVDGVYTNTQNVS